MDTRFQSDDRESHLQSNLDKPAYRRQVDPPSIVLPDKSERSIIKEQETDEGFVLSWNPASGYSVGEYLGFGFLNTLLLLLVIGDFAVFVTLFLVFLSIQFGEDPFTGPGVDGIYGGLLLFGAFWTIVGIVTIRHIRRMSRPVKPERVILTAQWLRHDPGEKHLFRSSTWKPAAAKLEDLASCWEDVQKAKGKPRQFDRDRLSAFVLEVVSERQRLTFDSGADRIEIGEKLNDADRHWLHQVLETWRQHATS